jgi:hypothetical protein
MTDIEASKTIALRITRLPIANQSYSVVNPLAFAYRTDARTAIAAFAHCSGCG